MSDADFAAGNSPSSTADTTTCCIVGGGPAGAVLALLLARAGVRVTLLEARGDFDREFRGDTLHPAVLEALETLGLAERVLGLPHAKVERFVVRAGPDEATFAEFKGLRTRYPFIAMLPQASLLELLVAEAKRDDHCRVVMNARVEGLLHDADGACAGVRYRTQGGLTDLRATLVVAADGRFSQVRRLAGLEADLSTATSTGAGGEMDVLWFKLPGEPGDPPATGATFRFGVGGLLVLMRHADGWQGGLILEKGGFPALKRAGIAALHETVAQLAPEFAARATGLLDWRQTSLLSVVSGCLPRWCAPGVLLIGDAAHPASPVGGVGINLAIQDALEAARQLTAPLQRGQVKLGDLERVERARRGPTRLVQACQGFAQRWVVARVLRSRANAGVTMRLPWWLRAALRVPALQRLPGAMIAFAARPRAQVPRAVLSRAHSAQPEDPSTTTVEA